MVLSHVCWVSDREGALSSGPQSCPCPYLLKGIEGLSDIQVTPQLTFTGRFTGLPDGPTEYSVAIGSLGKQINIFA